MFWLKFTATVVVVALCSTSVRADRPTRLVLDVMHQYFDLLVSGNTEIAGDMWLPESLERSQRFGITFDDIALKQDCSSPYIRDLSRLRADAAPPSKRFKELENGWAWIEFSAIVGNRLDHHKYFLHKRGEWYWLGYPQDYYGANWSVQESKYFRVHSDSSVQGYVGPLLLTEADRFIEAMVDTLGLSNESLKEIREKKIEYFFCYGDTGVEAITGHRAKGMLDLPSNDVISAVIPHYHEIVHLLINIKLKEMPLYTLPLLREGMAVRYGGRWGKSTNSLIDLGVFLYREKILEVDSMLTMRGFDDQASADIVYPLSGVFCGFLVDRLGLDKTLELYLELSGPFKTVYGWSEEEIKGVLAQRLKLEDWPAVLAEFDRYIDDRISDHVVAAPGGLKKGKPVYQHGPVSVSEDKVWLAFEFSPRESDSLPHGNLLFGPIEEAASIRSTLFEEHYGDSVEYEGYRFGVRYDGNEAGLYDYLTNQLIAKYIWGITPSDDYLNLETNTVSIRFKKSLVNEVRPESNRIKLLLN